MKQSQKIMGKKRKAEILRMRGVCDNLAILVHCLPANIIYYLQIYFQYQTEQNNLKSETKIRYTTKMRKTRDNNGKFES